MKRLALVAAAVLVAACSTKEAPKTDTAAPAMAPAPAPDADTAMKMDSAADEDGHGRREDGHGRQEGWIPATKKP